MSIELIPNDNTCKTCGIESEIEKRSKQLEAVFRCVIEYFQEHNPNPTTELRYKNPYELLIAVILSARCTDKRVNSVTKKLFEKYPTPDALSKATSGDVYSYISSVTFPNNKSDYIIGTAKMLVDKYDGNVPIDDKKLQKLPGVGKKTASVVMATLFNAPTIAVDTHVTRVSDRIGLSTNATTSSEIAEQLSLYTPKNVRSKMSHWLVLHGRYICKATSPECGQCGIREHCRYYENFLKA
jgi:endonuclease III